jgi:GTP-binding protein HflX
MTTSPRTKIHDVVQPGQNKVNAILVGIHYSKDPSSIHTLDELNGLADTADYQAAAYLTQKLASINPHTFIGKGKAEELLQAVKFHKAEAVIFDANLSPAQTRNLERMLSCTIVDRTRLILEIFSSHAQTREAKTQVKLAQLNYALPRLTKMWGHLSRQRGGIGMRDVGETQIQLDRRLIRDDIAKLKKRLKSLHLEKQTQRKSRQNIYKAALVGYTNAGKSSLMNVLTGADTLVEDKLFATLDATTRKIKKNFPYPVLLIDTVGLIDKLPHDLVASFKSTLDEVREANLLLQVVDISHPDFKRQMKTAENLLIELGAQDNDSLLVFNKTDKVDDQEFLQNIKMQYPDAVFVSCRKGSGMKELGSAIVKQYEKHLTHMQIELKYPQTKLVSEIRKYALIVNEVYKESDLTLELRVFPGREKKIKTIIKEALTSGATPTTP